MNPFAQLAVEDDEDDYVQPVASNKPKKSTPFNIQRIKSENSPNSKRYKKLKKLPKGRFSLPIKLSLKKSNKTLKLETIEPSPKRS